MIMGIAVAPLVALIAGIIDVLGLVSGLMPGLMA